MLAPTSITVLSGRMRAAQCAIVSLSKLPVRHNVRPMSVAGSKKKRRPAMIRDGRKTRRNRVRALWARLLDLFNGSLDPQLLDPIAQRAEAHSQQLRGRRLVVSGLLQRLHDGVPLDVFELRSERAAPLGRRGHGGGRAVRCEHLWRVRLWTR